MEGDPKSPKAPLLPISMSQDSNTNAATPSGSGQTDTADLRSDNDRLRRRMTELEAELAMRADAARRAVFAVDRRQRAGNDLREGCRQASVCAGE